MRNKQLKIAFIGTRGIPATYGGTETYVERISRYLANQGDEVVVYCKTSESNAKKTEADALYPPNLKRIELPSIATKHLDNITRSFLSTIHACLDRKIDIVQFNNAGPAFFSIIPRLFGKKVVGAIRAIDSQREKWNPLAQAFLRFCDYVIVNVPHVSTVNSLAMKEYYFNKYQRDTIYIPNGVEIPEPITRTNLLNELGLEDKKYILFAARLEPEKGCHALVEAYEKVISKLDTDIKLAIAGASKYGGQYYEELLSHQTDRIKFLGQIEPDKLNELYNNAFCFVLPSSVEGMSNSLLSAMNYGIPCIVSNIPENLAVLEEAEKNDILNDKPGLSFKLGDTEHLAKQLTHLINNPQYAALRGDLLQSHVRKEFALESMFTKTRQVYLDLLSKDDD